MFRVAICDDLPDQIELIEAETKAYFKAKDREVVCETFDNPFLFLGKLETGNMYDLLLLDICMPGILGTDIAKEMRKHKDKTAIVFLTTSRDFAIEAFSLQAAHYLVKPFSKEQFFEALDRICPAIVSLHKKKIVIKLRDGTCTVDCDEIIMVESEGHILHIHMNDGTCLQTRQALNKFYDDLTCLTGQKFMNPYKGFLVNQDCIKIIGENGITLDDGSSVPVSRQKLGKLKKQYFKYMFPST